MRVNESFVGVYINILKNCKLIFCRDAAVCTEVQRNFSYATPTLSANILA